MRNVVDQLDYWNFPVDRGSCSMVDSIKHSNVYFWFIQMHYNE